MNTVLWQRHLYQPVIPLGEDGKRITASKEHIALSRKAAGEGMVLLKNGGALPLAKGQSVVLLGKGTIDFVKGGGGSGDVTVPYIRNFYEGMKEKEAEGKVRLFHELAAFYEDNVTAQYEAGAAPGMTVEPAVPSELMDRAAAFADTAILTICRFSGEGWDREAKAALEGYRIGPRELRFMELSMKLFPKGDYYLTAEEAAVLELAKSRFEKVIVILNVGGMVDTTWFKNDPEISSVLMAFQGGMEGGAATADIICGDVCPSGRLSDTYADSLAAYPSTEGFHTSPFYVDYNEDIYVGYRYFGTIPGAASKINYPFGYGLSYTSFQSEVYGVKADDDDLTFLVRVTNTGKVKGKEVVQIYASAPQGKLGKPARVLVAFAKTKALAPEESTVLELHADMKAIASFDDLGKIQKAAWILEAGDYAFYLGANSRDTGDIVYSLSVPEDRIVKQAVSLCRPYQLAKRMLADGSYEELPVSNLPAEDPNLERGDKYTRDGRMPDQKAYVPGYRRMQVKRPQLAEVAAGELTLDEFLSALPLDVKIDLLGGQPNTGVANTYSLGNQPAYGIPTISTADGPAGLRILPECGVCTTAWPCATLLASTWDTGLLEKIGAAAALEVKENNIGIWLTPAVNIHRSPLCGRNFEYYSEDPYLTGKMASSMVQGIQSRGIGVSVKHFACNNKETNRKDSDSRVSERALREIYLKAFEIIVKEADPYTIMSSYNIINGTHTSENHDLLTGILREDWGFKGIVTTDWWTFGEHEREMKAGNDLKMASGFPERVREAYEKGYVSEEEIDSCVKRILQTILKFA